jgi:hypothetical protein
MIVETIITGLTVIFVSSLAFANAQIKRQRQWEKEDAGEELDPIRPFLKIAYGVDCPLCGKAAGLYDGLRQPKTCSSKEKCKVTIPHLHVECTWCKSKWLMRTADQKDSKNDR